MEPEDELESERIRANPEPEPRLVLGKLGSLGWAASIELLVRETEWANEVEPVEERAAFIELRVDGIWLLLFLLVPPPN